MAATYALRHFADATLEPLQASLFHLQWSAIHHFSRRVPGRALKMKLNDWSKPTSSIKRMVLELFIGFAGEPTIKSDDRLIQDDAGAARRILDLYSNAECRVSSMPETVRAALHRQMQMADQPGTSA